jgi:hypothetical protein
MGHPQSPRSQTQQQPTRPQGRGPVVPAGARTGAARWRASRRRPQRRRPRSPALPLPLPAGRLPGRGQGARCRCRTGTGGARAVTDPPPGPPRADRVTAVGWVQTHPRATARRRRRHRDAAHCRRRRRAQGVRRQRAAPRWQRAWGSAAVRWAHCGTAAWEGASRPGPGCPLRRARRPQGTTPRWERTPRYGAPRRQRMQTARRSRPRRARGPRWRRAPGQPWACEAPPPRGAAAQRDWACGAAWPWPQPQPMPRPRRMTWRQRRRRGRRRGQKQGLADPGLWPRRWSRPHRHAWPADAAARRWRGHCTPGGEQAAPTQAVVTAGVAEVERCVVSLCVCVCASACARVCVRVGDCVAGAMHSALEVSGKKGRWKTEATREPHVTHTCGWWWVVHVGRARAQATYAAGGGTCATAGTLMCGGRWVGAEGAPPPPPPPDDA